MVDIRTLDIDKVEFESTLRDYLTSPTKETIFRSSHAEARLRDKESQLGESNGLLLELFSFYFFGRARHPGDNDRTEWSYVVGGDEIDLLIKTGDVLLFIECRKQQLINGIAGARRFYEKVDRGVANKNFRTEWGVTLGSPIERVMVLWDRPDPIAYDGLVKLGLSVIALSDRLISLELPRRVRDRLRAAFERPGVSEEYR